MRARGLEERLSGFAGWVIGVVDNLPSRKTTFVCRELPGAVVALFVEWTEILDTRPLTSSTKSISTEPGVPIAAGALLEPASGLLATVGALLGLLRRRRPSPGLWRRVFGRVAVVWTASNARGGLDRSNAI